MKHNMWFTHTSTFVDCSMICITCLQIQCVSILASGFQSLLLSLTRDLTESVSNWLHLLQSFTTVCKWLGNYCPSFIGFLLTVTGTVHECQVVLVLLWNKPSLMSLTKITMLRYFHHTVHIND